MFLGSVRVMDLSQIIAPITSHNFSGFDENDFRTVGEFDLKQSRKPKYR